MLYLASSHQSRHLIFLPPFDRRRIPRGKVKMVHREHADAQPDGYTRGEVEDEEQHFSQVGLGLLSA